MYIYTYTNNICICIKKCIHNEWEASKIISPLLYTTALTFISSSFSQYSINHNLYFIFKINIINYKIYPHNQGSWNHVELTGSDRTGHWLAQFGLFFRFLSLAIQKSIEPYPNQPQTTCFSRFSPVWIRTGYTVIGYKMCFLYNWAFDKNSREASRKVFSSFSAIQIPKNQEKIQIQSI